MGPADRMTFGSSSFSATSPQPSPLWTSPNPEVPGNKPTRPEASPQRGTRRHKQTHTWSLPSLFYLLLGPPTPKQSPPPARGQTLRFSQETAWGEAGCHSHLRPCPSYARPRAPAFGEREPASFRKPSPSNPTSPAVQSAARWPAHLLPPRVRRDAPSIAQTAGSSTSKKFAR